jgi:hypothetical protein
METKYYHGRVTPQQIAQGLVITFNRSLLKL